MKSSLIMIAVCVVPFILFFSFPFFGFSGDLSLLFFIALIFGGHLLMLTWHTRQNHEHNGYSNSMEIHDEN